MTTLLGKTFASRNPLLRKLLTVKYVKHRTSSYCKTTISNYKLDEKLLLSEENQHSCIAKLCQFIPAHNTLIKAKRDKIFAAVLIALCTDENMQNLSILYTRRSHLLSRHMRQISFPGGIKENSEDFIQCALRETQEEIGLPPTRFKIWGCGNLITPPRTAAIMPVIGVLKHFKESELNLNYSEVEEAFLIPVKKLASPEALHYTQFRTGYSSPVFVVDNKRIWGVTGFITNIFLNCFLPRVLNNVRNRVKYIKPFNIK